MVATLAKGHMDRHVWNFRRNQPLSNGDPAILPPVEFNVPDGIPPDQISSLQRTMVCLLRLAALRAKEIRVVGALAQSKVAWKVTTHEQAFLYCCVTLSSGAALVMNARNALMG